MNKEAVLILITKDQLIAKQINRLAEAIPQEPYTIEWASNAANLNHAMHRQDTGLILLHSAALSAPEVMIVLQRHQRNDLPVILLQDSDQSATSDKITITQSLQLVGLDADQLQNTLQQYVDISAIASTPAAPTKSDSPQLIHILDFFNDCLSETQTAADEKGVTVFTTYDEGLYNMVVNETQLKQTIRTFLNEALEQTDTKDSIGLEVLGDQQQETLHITIWDTGDGNIEHRLANTSDPTSAEKALQRAVKAIYQQESTISTRGIPNRGSSITVSIPWIASLTAKKPAAVLEDQESQRILIVDDHALNVDTIDSYLSTKGFFTFSAENGADAIEKVEAHHPDLILMDINMPVMDGLEAIRRIRAHEDARIAKIPIIALTVLSMSSDRKDCLVAGANDYISKPVSLRWLEQSIRMYLKAAAPQ